jgi:hypothetical protein
MSDLLKVYLQVHDGIFAHPWWHNIPIPGLFKSIPFDQYESQISMVEQTLRASERKIQNLLTEATSREKAYLAALHQYTVALLKAVIAIRPVVAGLKGKSDGKAYPWITYNADLAVYKDAEKGYQALGKAMNQQWQSYQLDSSAERTNEASDVRV